jgi:NADH:ubiquinone oxidoreductase subunit B-like Fe-S oxidoreductase
MRIDSRKQFSVGMVTPKVARGLQRVFAELFEPKRVVDDST